MKKRRYQKMSNHTGIKRDISNGTYLALKYVNGKEFSRVFNSLRDAIQWRATFHPSLPKESVNNSIIEDEAPRLTVKPCFRLNGEDLGYYFRDVWTLYKELYLISLETTSQHNRLAKEPFLKPLMDFKMVEITAALLDRLVSDKKKEAIKIKSKRCNFNDELKCLKAILNWYRLNYDPLFVTPVLPRHKMAGFIKKVEKKNKKMSAEEVLSFFSQLSPFWRDFAETQFYLAGRVGEVAGLQDECVDLVEQVITIKYVVVWGRTTKCFDHLKDVPKNGEERYVFMNQRLNEILCRRIPLAKNGFVFHMDGKPLAYRQIQYQYNTALKKAGLFPKYSSTHIMRHSMGTITRKVTGSLDAAQAVTGHKDIKMVQHYASLPSEANKMAVNEVNAFMSKLEKSGNQKVENRFRIV